MLQVSELFIYPIKSLGGIALSSSRVSDRGLEHDRRWMLVDEDGCFLTQRTNPQLALFAMEKHDDHLTVFNKLQNASIAIPFLPSEESILVQVWSDRCRARVVSNEINEWFSQALSKSCKLVYMPDATMRRVDGRYVQNKEITSFSDAFPFLIIGQSSLDDLNSRLRDALPMNRFRPNIVYTGGLPYEEDTWAHFSINNIDFFGKKLCARCVVTTINQDNMSMGKEPLKTLSTYRKLNNKIYFGQNLVHKGEGRISIGNAIEVKERKATRLAASNHLI